MTKTYKLLDAGHFYSSNSKGLLGGNRRAKIYGRLNCPAALRAILPCPMTVITLCRMIPAVASSKPIPKRSRYLVTTCARSYSRFLLST